MIAKSRWIAAVGLLAALAAASAAQSQSAPLAQSAPLSQPAAPAASPPSPTAVPPAAPALDKMALKDDGLSRMTIAVMVDGQGPFPFLVDTGADRTVISSELAATLKLPAGPRVLLHDTAGSQQIQTAVIDRLDLGKRTVGPIEAPMISAANLGAMGLLGIDSLRDQHIVLDFKTRKMLSSASRGESFEPGVIVVRGKSRFGELVLVDARVRGVPVWVILDSGAQNSVGNPTLRRLLTDNDSSKRRPTQVISITGGQTPGEFEDISEMNIGELTIRNMPLAFADLSTFSQFGLTDRPAMLLGMDVLGLCQKVTVDFKRREATFTLKRES